MSDVMSRDDKGRHYDMQNDRKNRGKMGGFVTQSNSIWTSLKTQLELTGLEPDSNFIAVCQVHYLVPHTQ
jgi:hypothetical protein